LSLAVAALLAAFAWASPLHAEINRSGCGPRDEIAALLEKNYGERPVNRGLKMDGVLLEIFASGVTGTWTRVWTWPNDQSCVMGAGDGWQAVPVKPGGSL
jgi:hypothetical protein